MTFNPRELARKAVLSITPYTPPRRDLDRALWLDANESSAQGTAGIERYPEAPDDILKSCMTSYYGTKADNVLLTRGSDDAIDALCRAFLNPNDQVITLPPTFSMYRQCASLMGAKVVEVPLEGKNFSLNEEKLQDILSSNNVKLVFLCSPNNPTGVGLSHGQIEAITKTALKSETLIVVDEAYAEFSSTESAIPLLETYPNLVVLRTLSKAFGLAGARIGVLLASPAILELVTRVLPPYLIPSPSLKLAKDAFSASGLARLRNRVAMVTDERDRVFQKLQTSGLIEKITESQGNFLFFKPKNKTNVLTKLKAANIHIRCFDGVIKNWLRVTIGAKDENNLFLSALGLEEQSPAQRQAETTRTTKETDIFVSVNLDQSSPVSIATGLNFFDHMLEQIAKHGGFSLTLSCDGDTEVDAHHTVEDCMLALGETLKKALGNRQGINRYGFTLPMDETRAEVLIDLSGRPASQIKLALSSDQVGDFPTQMASHAFESLALSLGAAIHVTSEGNNDHHVIEGAFKALGRALRQAFTKDTKDTSIPSTKGVL